RAKAIATAQAEVDQLEEPRRRLERLQHEAFNAGVREDQAVAALESQLRDRWPRELQRFADMVERCYASLRQGVHAQLVTNAVTGATTIFNQAELDRHRATLET